MKLKIYISIFALSLVFSACDEDNTLETIDEIAVEAYLHAGQPVDTVKFRRVIPLDAGSTDAVPENLSPIIKTEDGTSYPLAFTGTEGVYANTELIIVEGLSYSFEVEYAGNIISAETFIPAAPESVILSDSVVYRDKITDFTDLFDQGVPDPMEVNWEGEEGAFYFVNVKNMEDDPEVINEVFEDGERPGLPEFQTEPSPTTTYAINAFQDITHYGRYEVRVYRVNPEYVVLYEDNASGAGSINQISTNVQNGFGIFTGINSQATYFEVRKP